MDKIAALSSVKEKGETREAAWEVFKEVVATKLQRLREVLVGVGLREDRERNRGEHEPWLGEIKEGRHRHPPGRLSDFCASDVRCTDGNTSNFRLLKCSV